MIRLLADERAAPDIPASLCPFARQEDGMKSFGGKIAVVTGGGTGMGRELVRQLAAEGCHVSLCDVSNENMQQTKALAEEGAPRGTLVHTFVADVSSEPDLLAFRTAVADAHETDCVNLVFNNAGIGGGGSLIETPREEWEKTFAVCWYGVYFGTRTFLPMLIASEEGHLVNTSSVNGFWASLGPMTAHTAYSAAKFAVKGFTEALINDCRLHAPHVKVSLVMPGHIGTSIITNSARMLGNDPKEMSDEKLRQALVLWGERFRDAAPMTAAEAAKVILDGVKEERWRILVGEDAKVMDRLVREKPEDAYEAVFIERLRAEVPWGLAG